MIEKKTKNVVCSFDKDEKEVCAIFDREGFLYPSGKYIDAPKLTEEK